MSGKKVLGLAVLGTFLLGPVGCGWTTDKSPAAQREKPTASLDRYELHDVRNGNASATALLDKQTGRVWILTGTKDDPMHRFEVIDVFPAPYFEAQQGAPCPWDDPLGLSQARPCTPLPSTKGDKQ
jgi:hypothetical protein